MFIRIKIWIKVLFYFLASIKCNKNAVILDANETKEIILRKNKSVIRFGDGEFNILKGKGIHYQDYTEELRKSLENIINEYLSYQKEGNYLLCMPGEFLRCNGFKLAKKRVYISSWAYSRYIFKKEYDKNVIYGESFLFAEENHSVYSQIWLNAENVIFVHNDNKYAKFFEEQYKIKTQFIEVPSRNAFIEKDKILAEIISQTNKLKNSLVIISAGPTAKVLVYELAKRGIWAIDTGHCWDKPLQTRK